MAEKSGASSALGRCFPELFHSLPNGRQLLTIPTELEVKEDMGHPRVPEAIEVLPDFVERTDEQRACLRTGPL
jgi:hypothetical protein